MKTANLMSKIIFRVDSNTVVGMGHLMRCLTLSDYLQKVYKAEIIFCTNNFRGGVKRIEEKGYPIIRLNGTFNEKSELPILMDYMKKEPVDLFVVDMMRQRESFLSSLKKSTKVAYFCDDRDIHAYNVDLYMNHNICLSNSVCNDKATIYLLGPKYFILPTFFYEERRANSKKNEIFLNQGGGDPYNLTCKILRALKQVKNIEIKIVIGVAYKDEYKKELEVILENYPLPYNVYENANHQEMYQIMKDCIIAITAAGNTLYELCFLGIPSVVISHHDNHDIVARRFEQNNACLNLGIGNELNEELIPITVEHLLADSQKRREISLRAKNLVDGKGLKRVADSLMGLICCN
ncbi:MAG: UDP-2,4-diacetamido-2,4,6-trideoxy-beta-L-altropyranose hydrolase [Lentimicrobiaceae bacterium]|nr:UDP-2,4-diacetamido-2,4,6-trideoxy-beta-L-altropyranose hydrolase [Lentimicrobiaceae bacterium]